MGAVGELSRLALTGVLLLSIEHHRYELRSAIGSVTPNQLGVSLIGTKYALLYAVSN